ncbi:MAG: HEPN domain-containing protein [Lachnospiraceae bacterium]
MGKTLNSYYGMAENDYLYAKAGLTVCEKLGNYNAVASGCAQAAEKYLKALAERCLIEDSQAVAILRTHNLRTLVAAIKKELTYIDLNSKDCKWLGDYYYEARYPGDNFVLVSKEDAEECIRITEKICEIVTEELTKIAESKRSVGLFEDMKRL